MADNGIVPMLQRAAEAAANAMRDSGRDVHGNDHRGSVAGMTSEPYGAPVAASAE